MYSARITREHRSAFLLLIDCSGSMNEEIFLYGEQMKKSDGVTLIVNMFIEELINRSRREEGVVNYFDLCVLGYGDEKVSVMLGDERNPFTNVSELTARKTTTRTFNIVRDIPGGESAAFEFNQRCWVESRASGSTPMKAAMLKAYDIIGQWCDKKSNRKSFPPSIINITDGEASDAGNKELLDCASLLKSSATEDGNVLLFNIHLADAKNIHDCVSFPSALEELPKLKYAELLYEMSSQIPAVYNNMLKHYQRTSAPPYRAVCYNCPPDKLFGMLAIGSASITLMM